MELYIQIRDGKPFEHPIFGDNFREAFPHIDVNNLPPEFAKFERVPSPELAKQFQIDYVQYEWVDGIVKDVWYVRDMTEEEKQREIEGITNVLYQALQRFKDEAKEYLNSTTGDEYNAWLAYATELDAWVLVDPLKPKFPKMPRYLEDGTLVTTNTTGGAPSVIE